MQYRGLIAPTNGKILGYARVSSRAQKQDIQTQKRALRNSCQQQNIPVNEWIEDIGSALNDKRKGFNQIIEGFDLGHAKQLIIGYEDRLVDWFEEFCERHGTEIVNTTGGNE